MTLTVLKLAYVYKLVTQILMYVEAMAHTISLLTQQTPRLTRPCVGATASQGHTVVYASMVMGQHCSPNENETVHLGLGLGLGLGLVCDDLEPPGMVLYHLA